MSPASNKPDNGAGKKREKKHARSGKKHEGRRSQSFHTRHQTPTPKTRTQEQTGTVTNSFTGKISLTGKAVGYVPTELQDQDIEIATADLNTALHGDTVEIVVHPRKHNQRRSGQVIAIVERAQEEFVGTLLKENGHWYLDPDNRRMYVNLLIAENDASLKESHKAVVRMTGWSDPKREPHARVLEVLGRKGDHETEMEAIVRSQGFEYTYPEKVVLAAQKIQQNKEAVFAEEIPKRRDIRRTTTFTIDPFDAKDFDDAISVRMLENGAYEIGIHIADVSAWVKPNDAIDKEAQKRGTSIYLVDRTIPMLPEVLSNDVCSINPQEDKLAFSAIITFNPDHHIVDRWFGRTVIKSDRRFTYEEAQEIIETEAGEHVKEMTIARDIARTLRKQRFQNGAIAFETDEVQFTLDAKGRPVSVSLKERQEANMMIEDLMLLANREVPAYVQDACKKMKMDPCVMVYRVHERPDPEKLEKLTIFLSALGYELKQEEDGSIKAKSFNQLFEKIDGSPNQDLIETAAIRSMQKAVYSTRNIGHFGLAFSSYTHFTSPIRRYPDLMVHRLLARYLAGERIPGQERAQFEGLCKQSSQRELSAVEAERESIKLKQVEYMSEHVGEEFDGVVTGVNQWGLFIAEMNSKAEGLLHVTELSGDFYELDEHGYTLSGERTGKTFSLGDTVRVRLKGTDIEHKQIDWALPEE